MTATLSRAKQLRNDLENMQFSRKYLLGVLSELEQLGRTHTKEYANVKQNYDTLGNNIRRVQAELEKVEEDEYWNREYQRFIDGVDLSPWNN